MSIYSVFYQTVTIHVPDSTQVDADEYGNPIYNSVDSTIKCDIMMTGSSGAANDRETDSNTYRMLCAIDSGITASTYAEWIDPVSGVTHKLIVSGEPMLKFRRGTPSHLEVQLTEVQP